VPGTQVLMSKTEFTVGEWKLYLLAEGLPGWTQPSSSWTQRDDHPLVNINWHRAKEFCDWLSANTGKEWRLPTNAEWDAAVGNSAYPWGDHFPPKWDDGNYDILETGIEDPRKVGVDGIHGTAPVGSFKANALGFYDLGGNVWEWTWEPVDPKGGSRITRGGGWSYSLERISTAFRWVVKPGGAWENAGFRLVRKVGP